MATKQGRSKDGKFLKAEKTEEVVETKKVVSNPDIKVIAETKEYKITEQGRIQKYEVFLATKELLKELNAPQVIIDSNCQGAIWCRDSITGEQVHLN